MAKQSGEASRVNRYRPRSGSATPDALPARWICDGQETIARIFATGDRFLAVMADGRALGSFGTIADARAAVTDARRAALAS
jgi:hypothetical protein